MERFELEPSLQDEIRTRVMGEGFMKIVQTVRRNGKLFKIVMRPSRDRRPAKVSGGDDG